MLIAYVARCTCRKWMKDRGIDETSEEHPNPKCPYARRTPQEGEDHAE